MSDPSDSIDNVDEEVNLFLEKWQAIDWQAFTWSIVLLILQIFLALIIFFILRRIGRFTIEKIFTKYIEEKHTVPNRLNTLHKLSKNIFNAVLYFFLVYTILELIGIPVGTLLASAGVLGLALSLGAQGFVSDIVNGFMILLEKQIDVGDVVEIKGINGTVEDVNLKTTQVKDFDGTLHYIPNREITIVSNLSRADMRVRIKIKLFAATDLERVRKVLTHVNKTSLPEYDEITIEPTEISFVPISPGQIAVQITMFSEAGTQYDIRNIFYEKYVAALIKDGIALPNATFELSGE
ncbi:MAG: mechanosensitive ion channel family protein [Alkalibacterium gilvum]|uniref:Small conductance mechanosensitive channel n=1 Tax=Alkalibacterium gilvum TaxID=1130080 RepID=A0A1H6RIN4_9LACT|nr:MULTISPECIES: mechanosensitive ion channel family protein [Alkalibacterium]MDN6293468.1 mechanosensitive ion channel family protein [Alkalibacterium sp.]MDN6295189.1 mechanosensitive ion channel family protein [Alkalibacterium sp.]MDN6386034.1 mechanosensitive ion channel family protein [Alkalibacterium sp.]MDN6728922.1 mechanosensitive ion channel family protein [Alkalibacterium sp.]SEI52387.1 small conductance mechanosensitive channel [Alkalibacterium gilvum]